MATKRSLDNLVEAANMIEKARGGQSSDVIFQRAMADQSSGNPGSPITDSLSAYRQNHNVLERHRRAQMRCNFNMLQDLLPSLAGQKASNVNILKEATDVILKLRKEDMMRQSEKAKLVKYKECLKAKIKLLQDSCKTKYSNKSSTIEIEAIDRPVKRHLEPHIANEPSTSEVGVNTELTLFDAEDENITWGNDEELHIEIED
ncbi:protein max-like isoform X2 [Rhopilema esculentum]|uniref:protein max-like isoform X2 n=2 Tax=Rhopilema esculentum TaxID=499914 RepID=UPI0031CFD040